VRREQLHQEISGSTQHQPLPVVDWKRWFASSEILVEVVSAMARSVRVLLAMLISASVAQLPFRGSADDNRPDDPLVRWSFDDRLPGAVQGLAHRRAHGPRAPLYPGFDAGNTALSLESPAWLRIPDQNAKGRFDFDNGDAITLEAWVMPTRLQENAYIVGKGRTAANGPQSVNQNWALRLRKQAGRACVNFLFRSRPDSNGAGDWHRWTSTSGFSTGRRWHHVAVSYTFGKPASIRGFVDGRRVEGKWDLGGATERPPVVDDDEVWIGSSMAGNLGNSFHGAIDEIAIHRRAVPAADLQSRFRWKPPQLKPPSIPADKVVVQLFGPVDSISEFPAYTESPLITWRQDELAFVRVPHKYDAWGIREDWGQTLLVRAWCKLELKPGTYQFLSRSRGRSRLQIDGKPVLMTATQKNRSGAHHEVDDLPAVAVAGMRPHAMNDDEQIAEFSTAGGTHRVLYEFIIGGPKYRTECGETCVAIAEPEAMFTIASPTSKYPLTDPGWWSCIEAQRSDLQALDAANRRTANQGMSAYWARRHAYARSALISESRPRTIDQLISDHIAQANPPPAVPLQPVVDDHTFLRRVFIDTVGVPPTLAETRAYLRDGSSVRRSLLVDRLLSDPRWADNWVGYWQDVFAENPNLLKPTLNNTGPFRWWIHEAMADNKSVDRFATELMLMRGSAWGGGTAGFAIASQNDVPMAAKAHVVGTAFLGVNMKCARCHDAPYHQWKQSELFQLAAMLDRKQLKLPSSSTVPAAFFEKQQRKSLIDVTLRPGAVVKAIWPFDSIAPPVDRNLLLSKNDTREQLAVQVTASRRFAEVMANRVWARVMGAGLVEPVDDWEDNPPSNPDLLAVLADELIRHDYDLQALARVIFTSQAYQRQAIDVPSSGGRWFAGSYRRRMSAEQIVDSAFHVVGQRMQTEPLTLDVEGAYPASRFLNFGYPRRAWEFTTMANERDRPSLALPRAQAIADVLKAFGWRNSRPEPVSTRDDTPNLIQPGVLANGTMGVWLTRLSDNSGLTRMMLRPRPVAELVDDLFLRLLTRNPTAEERRHFVSLLTPGYAERIVPATAVEAVQTPHRFRYVSWSNHLKPDASSIKLEMQQAARRGPPPTRFLRSAWRQRAEDAVWALLNSPEMILVP